MKPEVKREIISLCQVLTLAGLVENPYPMVDRRQELKWERAGRAYFGCPHCNRRGIKLYDAGRV